MTEAQRKAFERSLHDSFVTEAIVLKTGLNRREVHELVMELVADSFIGRAVQQAGPETAGVVAAIAQEMLDD